MQAGSELRDVSAFLAAYMERCVKPAGLRSIAAVRSRVGVLKEHLGELSLTELEDPDVINRFKTDSEYAEDVEIATMHRVLETLRAAMNWGMAQTPPLFNRSPFHRFGVRLNKKVETARDRRLPRGEEKRLLDAALQKMNTPEHQNVGALLHDRIIGALELCCRRGEMLMIQNKRVNWDTCQIGIPGATAKDKENRRIPFNPNGRVAAILERRAALGPDAFVFGVRDVLGRRVSGDRNRVRGQPYIDFGSEVKTAPIVLSRRFGFPGQKGAFIATVFRTP